MAPRVTVGLLAVIALASTPVQAQSFSEETAHSAAASTEGAEPAVPVDGGLGLLALAGAGLTAHQLRRRRRRHRLRVLRAARA